MGPDAAQIPSWVQAGGVLAFAVAVWWEQRQMRRDMRELRDAIVALVTQAGLATHGRNHRRRTSPLGIPAVEQPE